MLYRLLTYFIILFLLGCKADKSYTVSDIHERDVFFRAVDVLTEVMVHDIFAPPVVSRVYSYPGIAAYEILRQGHPNFLSLLPQLNGDIETIPTIPKSNNDINISLSAIFAYLEVGKALIFSEDKIDNFVNEIKDEYRNKGMASSMIKKSHTYAKDVASHILAWANKDGYLESRSMEKYTVSHQEGKWQPTPPAYLQAIEPNWKHIRPFVMRESAQFKPLPPPPYDMNLNSDFRQEVDEVYNITSKLTQEQIDIALFWDCNPYVVHIKGHFMYAIKKITPGAHWIAITNIASQKLNMDLFHSIASYTYIAIALSDAFISNWDEKYRSNLVRPETVINKEIDSEWTPILQTPPFPEYTSGHSVVSTTAAVILTALYGDEFQFDDTSEVDYGLPVRSFNSFLEAAQEAAISRLYGGIHYRSAIDEGVRQGKVLGEFILSTLYLQKSKKHNLLSPMNLSTVIAP